jgi:hypothetical protein
MIGKLMNNEESNAALVLALSSALMVLVAKGEGTLSLGRVVAGTLSNPVPVRGATGMRSDTSIPVPDRQIAA